MKLSPHFDLSELVVTQQRGIDNTPTQEVLANLARTAELLENIRKYLGDRSIIVTSGYRSPAINAAVGGVANSAHITGRAADFICPGFGSPYEVAKAIELSDIEYDQLIVEYRAWVHVAWATVPRNEHWTYLPGQVLKGIVA